MSVPSHNVNFGSRAFHVSAPRIWNTLPPSVRHCKPLFAIRRNSLLSVCFYWAIATQPQMRPDSYQKLALYKPFTYISQRIYSDRTLNAECFVVDRYCIWSSRYCRRPAGLCSAVVHYDLCWVVSAVSTIYGFFTQSVKTKQETRIKQETYDSDRMFPQ